MWMRGASSGATRRIHHFSSPSIKFGLTTSSPGPAPPPAERIQVIFSQQLANSLVLRIRDTVRDVKRLFSSLFYTPLHPLLKGPVPASRIRRIFTLDIECILKQGQGLRKIGFVPQFLFFAPRQGTRPGTVISVPCGQSVTVPHSYPGCQVLRPRACGTAPWP